MILFLLMFLILYTGCDLYTIHFSKKENSGENSKDNSNSSSSSSNPTQFNGVMLLENMQGDILTDQADGIIGSLGLMSSACIGPTKSYVEPAHGSAPDISGKNIANPYSMIGSVALKLEKCFDLNEEAKLVWDSMINLFKDGFRTIDLADQRTEKSKILSTSDFGNRVVEYIK